MNRIYEIIMITFKDFDSANYSRQWCHYDDNMTNTSHSHNKHDINSLIRAS